MVFSGPEICIHRHIPQNLPSPLPFSSSPRFFHHNTTRPIHHIRRKKPSKRHRRRIERISKSRSSCSGNSEDLFCAIRLARARPRERIFDSDRPRRRCWGPDVLGGLPTVVIVKLFGPSGSPAARAWRPELPTASLHSALRAKPAPRC